MKKFIFKIILFLLPVLLPLATAELLIRQIPNDYKNKNLAIINQGKNYETLILGSSHTHLGINPAYLDSKSYNLAFIGESIDLTSKVYQNFEENLDNIKTIIFPISYHTFYSPGLSKKWIKNYSIYYDIKISDLPVDNLEILNRDFKTIKDDIFNYYFKGQDSIYMQSDVLGWRYGMGSNTKNYESAAKKTLIRHTHKDNGQVEKNFDKLLDLIKVWNSSNKKVILITTPLHEAYARGMNRIQWQKTIEKAEFLAREYDGVVYFNFYDDKRFKEDDFKDGDHLNSKGAKKITQILNNIINRTNLSYE